MSAAKLGSGSTYRLAYSATVSNAGDAPLTLVLDGTLSQATVRYDARERVVRMSFEGQFRTERGDAGASGAEQAERLTRSVSAPFYVVYDGAGQVNELRFERGLNRLAQTLWRSIVCSAQLLAAPERGAPLWQTDERDENGIFLAQYSAQGAAIEKHKLRYRKSYADNVQHRVLASSAHFELSSDGTATKVDVDESLGVKASLPMPEMQAHSVLHLSRLAAEQVAIAPEWLLESSRFEVLSLVDAGTSTALRSELDHAMAARFGFDEALLALQSHPGEKHEHDGEAYNALMAHLRLDPALTARVVQHIREGGPLKKLLISALRDAGTAEAQRALSALLKEGNLDADDRLQVVRGLSRVDSPTAETVRELQALQSDPLLGEQAQYGLGSNAYHLAQTNPELASQVVSDLTARLAAAPDDDSRRRALLSLGNSGAESGLNATKPYLASSSESLASAATEALRRVPGAEADLLLAQQLRSAPSPQVRIAAAAAIRYRSLTPPLSAALAESLKLEPEARVRRAVLDVAAFFSAQSSVLREALAYTAQNDADPELRRIAGQSLGA